MSTAEEIKTQGEQSGNQPENKPAAPIMTANKM